MISRSWRFQRTIVFFGSADPIKLQLIASVSQPGLVVEQPDQFGLVMNKKTAKALGVALPPEVLATANELIE